MKWCIDKLNNIEKSKDSDILKLINNLLSIDILLTNENY